MVSWFQSIVGQEARRQVLAQSGGLPRRVYACVGGGSNAIGLFYPFLEDDGVAMTGVEAGGECIVDGKHLSLIHI